MILPHLLLHLENKQKNQPDYYFSTSFFRLCTNTSFKLIVVCNQKHLIIIYRWLDTFKNTKLTLLNMAENVENYRYIKNHLINRQEVYSVERRMKPFEVMFYLHITM
jgi:hypothetical protein